MLNIVDSLPVPQRGAEYGGQVWKRIEGRLPRAPPASWEFQRYCPLRGDGPPPARPSPCCWSAAFLAGRLYPPARQPDQMAALPASDPQTGERILLVAVGDYLERSQMVLVELANANPKGSLDISSEQERAADLVSESRLYRQTADHTGDTAVASVLDELDRVLMEISHAPSQISPEELEKLRQRLEAEGILFKIRVLGSNVRNQEEPASGNAPATARQKL